MKRSSSRRAFLAAAASSTVALAGCTGLDSVTGPGGGNDTPTDVEPTATDTTSSPTTGGTTTNETTETTTASPEEGFVDRGTVLDDFENLKLWGTIRGEATPEKKDAYRGSQSVRIQNPSGGAAGIYKAFPDGLDLRNHDLSIAVKMKQPAAGKVAMEVIAPARSDHLVSRRYVPEAMNDWMRIDLGYTGLRGDPIMKSVQELRLVMLTDGEPINFVVDDLRKVPKGSEKGKVILSFENTRASQYDVAFQEMQKRGFSGMVAAIPDKINSSGYLTTGELREMRDAGWNVVSSPHIGTPLPELSPDEQRRVIENSKEYLRLKGFREGQQFISIPYGRYDGTTLDLVDEFHEYGFAYGAGPNVVPPVGKNAVSTVSGQDLHGASRIVNLAAKYTQLAVVNFTSIGKNKNVPKKQFTHILDDIKAWEKKGKIDVITPEQLLKLDQS
jgi:hypothetical protein